VQLALLDLGRGRHTIQEVSERLSAYFHLRFAPDEIYRVVQSLSSQEPLEWDAASQTLELSRHARAVLEDQRRSGEQLQERVFDEWLNEIQVLHPELSQPDGAALIEDLQPFLARLAVMWSEEFLSALYPEQVDADGRLEDAITDALAALPPRPGILEDIRRQVFVAFLLSRSPERVRFLTGLLDAAMVVCMLVIDPDAVLMVQKQLGGLTLYCDTNLLFFLLGLSDPQTQIAVRELVGLSAEVAKLVVSLRTLTEFRDVLTSTRDHILKRPSEAAQKAKEYLAQGRHNPLTVYVSACAEMHRPISPRDFFAPFLSNVERMAADNGIQVVTDDYNELIKGDELEAETQYLLDGPFKYRGRRSLAEHDAFHRLLILHLRGPEPTTYGLAKFWFLTCDRRMPQYALLRRRAAFEAPFCLLSSAWLAFLRTLHPRTEDFARTTARLLFHPTLGIYDELAEEFIKQAQTKYEALTQWTHSIQCRTVASQLFEDMIVAETEREPASEDEGAHAEAGEESEWFAEIAAPAAAGTLTEDHRRREELEAQGAALEQRLSAAHHNLSAEKERTQQLKLTLIAVAVWAAAFAVLVVVQIMGGIEGRFVLAGIPWLAIPIAAFAINWSRLNVKWKLAMIILLAALAFSGGVLAYGFAAAWGPMAYISVAAGIVRTLGWLVEKFHSRGVGSVGTETASEEPADEEQEP
jgi:hypothetical protein